jgi:hypothetical protein
MFCKQEIVMSDRGAGNWLLYDLNGSVHERNRDQEGTDTATTIEAAFDIGPDRSQVKEGREDAFQPRNLNHILQLRIQRSDNLNLETIKRN